MDGTQVAYLGVVIAALAIAALAAALLLGLKLVPPGHAGVELRLGRFVCVLPAGRHFVAPFVTCIETVNITSQHLKLPKQEAISSDHHRIRLRCSLAVRVTDPKKALVDVSDYREAVRSLALTSLAAMISESDAANLENMRHFLGVRLAETLTKTTEKSWGVEVQTAFLKGVKDLGDIRAQAGPPDGPAAGTSRHQND
jgi:regulator of protease activity HflC (stomatin/prohibitin superfamily)